jgi:putative transposase
MMSLMKRIERIRLYPTASQRWRLAFMLDVTRELYNALLQQRRDAWRLRQRSIATKEQYRELTALRAEDARVAAVYRETEDAVLHRLGLAFAAFFRRMRNGETPGYPRFRGRSRWEQLEFSHGNRALKFNARQTKVKIPGIGLVSLRKGRQVPAFGRAWLVRKGDRSYACFECERQGAPLPKTGKIVGLDRGVHVLAATNEGTLIRNPRFLERARLLLGRLQRAVARRRRGGKNRRKAVRLLARAHERVKEARRDSMHKTARKIVNGNDAIVFEALDLRAMTRSARGTVEEPGRNVAAKAGLNRALLDSSFGLLRQMIVAKAEEAARTVVEVDPRYSSQECARCGQVAAESRRGRRYACVRCGYSVHADVNAALVIRRRAELRPAARGASVEDLADPRSVPDAGAEPARCDQEVAA